MKKKILISAIVALSLALLIAVGGTVAWLLDSTDEITNTFTPSDVEITLTETFNADLDASVPGNDAWVAQMIPGVSTAKNPVVTVTNKTNVEIYLFVKVTTTNSPETYLTYDLTLDDGTWTPLTTDPTVWYIKVKPSNTAQSWHLLNGDTVTVNDSVTKEMMAGLYNADGTVNGNACPTITFKAYAMQTATFDTAEAAWAELNTPTNP